MRNFSALSGRFSPVPPLTSTSTMGETSTSISRGLLVRRQPVMLKSDIAIPSRPPLPSVLLHSAPAPLPLPPGPGVQEPHEAGRQLRDPSVPCSHRVTVTRPPGSSCAERRAAAWMGMRSGRARRPPALTPPPGWIPAAGRESGGRGPSGACGARSSRRSRGTPGRSAPARRRARPSRRAACRGPGPVDRPPG